MTFIYLIIYLFFTDTPYDEIWNYIPRTLQPTASHNDLCKYAVVIKSSPCLKFTVLSGTKTVIQIILMILYVFRLTVFDF